MNQEISRLSDAERAIARLVFEGKTNVQIGVERGTSDRTVANQLASIYRKLGLHSRAELAAAVAK